MKELKTINTMYGEFKTNIVPKKYEKRSKWQPKNDKLVISFIPGTITALHVAEGDSVAKGDNIYGFKAMKMENLVQSEIDAVVKSVNINVGDSFSKGKVIIEFE